MRWSDQHAIRVWSQRAAQLEAAPVAAVPRADRPAITGGVTLNFINLTPAEQAEVIRQAIPGPRTAGKASPLARSGQ
jgi:hypothetical protein